MVKRRHNRSQLSSQLFRNRNGNESLWSRLRKRSSYSPYQICRINSTVLCFYYVLQVISSPTITKNNYNESNHVLISDKSTDVVDHHQRFVDDFGPETDVDAMDDPNTIKSPMEQQANDSINEYNLCNGVKPFSLENKIIQQLSEQNRDFLSDSNPFKNDHFDQFSDDHLMLEDTIENNHSPSEVVDNKIIDALESAVSNGDQEQYELDSEKQMETTLDASQKTSEIPDVTEKVDLMHEKTSFTLDDAFGEHPENPFNQPVNEEAALFEQGRLIMSQLYWVYKHG